jgi:hypothetical protein
MADLSNSATEYERTTSGDSFGVDRRFGAFG